MDEFKELPPAMHTKLTMELNKNVLQVYHSPYEMHRASRILLRLPCAF